MCCVILLELQFFTLNFTLESWLIYTLWKGSYTFLLLVRFGHWVTPIENPVIHSPLYLSENWIEGRCWLRPLKLWFPQCLLRVVNWDAKRVTSLLDAQGLLVLTLEGHSAFQWGGHLCVIFSVRFQWLHLPPCPYGARGVLAHCNQLSILALLPVMVLPPHFCK